MTETGIETGTETENVTAIESLTKLRAAVRGGGDAPLHRPHLMKGPADVLRKGK